MAEQVQGDVAQGHVLLELRGTGNPPAQALGQDQRVVTEPQRVLGDVRGSPGARRGNVLRAQGVARRDAGGAVRTHRCFTPSDLV